MLHSTSHPHHLSLYLFTACTLATMAVVSGFGIRNNIDPSLLVTTMTSNNRGGRRRRITLRHRTMGQLWSSMQEDGDDTTTTPSCTIVSSNTDITDDKSTSTRSTVLTQEETDNDNTINDDINDDRAGGLRKLMESFGGNSGNGNGKMSVGSTVVVSGLSLPHIGIEDWQSYELVSVYDQGVNEINGLPIKIPRTNLNEAKEKGYK